MAGRWGEGPAPPGKPWREALLVLRRAGWPLFPPVPGAAASLLASLKVMATGMWEPGDRQSPRAGLTPVEAKGPTWGEGRTALPGSGLVPAGEAGFGMRAPS